MSAYDSAAALAAYLLTHFGHLLVILGELPITQSAALKRTPKALAEH
jgi:hypothetical protein